MAVPVGVGDASDAFARFHDAYARRVRGLARHLLGSDPSVDDVVQETLWRAYRKGLHHDDGRDPWPWLATVARNSCHDVHRSRHGTGGLGEDLPLDDDPETAVVDAARRERVVGTLERLPERQRRLLVLRHVEGVPCDVLASSEGSSVDAVKSALARARGAFRSRYDGWRGLVPWGIGPVVARVRGAVAARVRGAVAASSRWPLTPRTGLAGGVATLFALGLLLPPDATGSEGAESPERPLPLEGAPSESLPVSPDPSIVEPSPVEEPIAAPPTSQPEGGKRVVSPPPTRRDARPAPGLALEATDPLDDELLDLPDLDVGEVEIGEVDIADLPGVEDAVTAADDVIETAVARLTRTVGEVSEPLGDTVDDLTLPLL